VNDLLRVMSTGEVKPYSLNAVRSSTALFEKPLRAESA